jgi:hypothetical protein
MSLIDFGSHELELLAGLVGKEVEQHLEDLRGGLSGVVGVVESDLRAWANKLNLAADLRELATRIESAKAAVEAMPASVPESAPAPAPEAQPSEAPVEPAPEPAPEASAVDAAELPTEVLPVVEAPPAEGS